VASPVVTTDHIVTSPVESPDAASPTSNDLVLHVEPASTTLPTDADVASSISIAQLSADELPSMTAGISLAQPADHPAGMTGGFPFLSLLTNRPVAFSWLNLPT